MRAHEVRCLLMGGQACILYGAAEFSRDADLAVLAGAENVRRLGTALAALEAHVEYVPPFEARYLERGHAVHFRCDREDVRDLRVDVMARMRGVDPFPQLWARRTTVALDDGRADPLPVDIMALPDLIQAKKTQRDKDWPMIRRLAEANYFAFREAASAARVTFWLRELRTAELLIECALAFPEAANVMAAERPAIAAAIDGAVESIERELASEQERERALDRAYWAPLRAELEYLRQQRRGPEEQR